VHVLGGAAPNFIGARRQIAGPAAMDKSSKQLWAQEDMPGLSIRQLYRRQEATRWPFIYGFSPSVVPRPPDWREGIEVAGYWWPANPAGWTPPEDPERFLAVFEAGHEAVEGLRGCCPPRTAGEQAIPGACWPLIGVLSRRRHPLRPPLTSANGPGSAREIVLPGNLG
jgi:hypothetical protein